VRVSVYCLGESVDIDLLYVRLETGGVPRPLIDHGWVDTLIDNSTLHSTLTLDSDQPPARPKRGHSVHWRASEDGAATDLGHDGHDERSGHDASEFETTDAFETEFETDTDGAPSRPRRKSSDGANGDESRRRARIPYDDAHDDSETEAVVTRHAFVFNYGCIVLWGFSSAEERAVVSALLGDSACVPGKTTAAERVEAHDTMLFARHDRHAPPLSLADSVKNDLVRLATDDALELISLSYAIAQSAKLFVWEARVDATIRDVKNIPERLADHGVTDLTEQQISKMIGKVFIERTQVNLHTDILDSPEFLWEDDLYEPAYVALREYLDVPERVEVLNQRLDVLKELLEVLTTQLANSHASKLEWIVVYLIIAEIIVTLVVFALDRLLPRHTGDRYD